MRATKFRGLGVNGWVYGDLISALSVRGEHPRIHWIKGKAECNQGVQPETVGEWIGKVDKNDVEIYEGDKIEYHYYKDYGQSGERVKYNAVVKWDNAKAGFHPFYNWDGYHVELKKDVEVVGNIHVAVEEVEE